MYSTTRAQLEKREFRETCHPEQMRIANAQRIPLRHVARCSTGFLDFDRNDSLEHPHSKKIRFWRHIAAPIDRHPVCARLLERQQFFRFSFCRVLPAQAFILFARFFIERRI